LTEKIVATLRVVDLKKATSKGRECSIYPLENNKRKRKCYLEREKYSKRVAGIEKSGAAGGNESSLHVLCMATQ
jgi:hypothetical protein